MIPAGRSAGVFSPMSANAAAIPSALFLVSFAFRLYFMNAGLFHGDEVMIAKAVEGTLDERRLMGGWNGRYGAVLLNLLLYVPYKAATGLGAEKVVVFSGVLSGSLSVAVLFMLVRELTNAKAPALSAALFFGFNPVVLSVSTTGKENNLHLLFFLLSLLLMAAGAGRRPGVARYAGFFAFAFSLTVHETGVSLIPVAIAFLACFDLSAGKRPGAVLGDIALFSIVTSVPFFPYLGRILYDALTVKGEHTVYFAGVLSPVLRDAAINLARTGAPLMALAVPGIPAMVRNRKFLLPLAVWAGLFFYYGNLSSFTPRYLIYVIVPMAVAAGISAWTIAGRIASASARSVALAAACASVCAYGIATAHPVLDHRRSYCGPKETALYIRDHTEPDAVILTTDESRHIEYYAGRKTLVHPVDALSPNRSFVGTIEKMVRSGGNVYINTTAYGYDSMGYFEILMANRFFFRKIGDVSDEDFHRSELELSVFTNTLYRIALDLPPALRSPPPSWR